MHANDSAGSVLPTPVPAGSARSDWRRSTASDDHPVSSVHGHRYADTLLHWARSHPNPPQSGIVACRLSVDSVDDLLCSSRDLTEPAVWEGVTHFVYRCLYIDANGAVEIGQPSHTKSEILSNPTTYLPVVRKIGLPVVFSMPDYGDPEVLTRILNKMGCTRFFESLKQLVNKYHMQFVELDAHVVRAVYESYVLQGCTDQFHTDMKALNAKLWLSFNNYYPIWPGLKHLLGSTLAEVVDTVVLRSYGFVKFNRLQTSHGVYQTMNVHPESALRHFESRFTLLKEYFEPQKIIMDMDTCGVEYLLNERSAVCGFRLIPLHEIRRQKMFTMLDYDESFDSANGCCMLKWPADRRVISYDNDDVRNKKVEFVRANQLKGVMVGEPHNDLPFSHRGTLLNFIRAFVAA